MNFEEEEEDNDNVKALNEQRISFEENMVKKESQMIELDRVYRSLSDELKAMQTKVRVKREREEYLKRVIIAYLKSLSILLRF